MNTIKLNYNAGKWKKIGSIRISMKDINRSKEINEYDALRNNLNETINKIVRNNYPGELNRFTEWAPSYVMDKHYMEDLQSCFRLRDSFVEYYTYNSVHYKIHIKRFEFPFFNFINVKIYIHVRN